MSDPTPRRLVVAMTGGSGSILGVRLLELLGKTDWQVHLTVSDTARRVLKHETGRRLEDVAELAFKVHAPDNFFAAIASGSFRTEGMVVVPCSMKTLAGIASGYSDNLILRAADVCLKERRPLVLVTRETPLSLIHLENMRTVTLAGAIVLPPVLTMYTKPEHQPESLGDQVDQIVGKILDLLGVDSEVYRRWGE